MKLEYPHNEDAEAILLGKSFNSLNSLNEIIDILDVQDFFSERHRAIYSCMIELYKLDVPIEVAAIYDLMKNKYAPIADLNYLLHLAQSGWGSADTRYYTSVCKETSKLRSMMDIMNANTLECVKREKPSEEIYESIQSNLDRLLNSSSNEDYDTLADVLQGKGTKDGLSFMQYIEKRQEMFATGETVLSGMSTGFPILDDTIDGINDGHFIILAASSGVGKTTVALNLMLNLLKQDIPIGMFSLEMSSEELTRRIACMHAGIDDRKVKNGSVKGDEYQKLLNSYKFLMEKRLCIEPRGSPRISQLEARTRRMIQTHGIKALFIDYFGNILADGKFGNRQEGMQQVSQRLCTLAKKLNLPIICLAQLNREYEKDTGSKKRAPRKSDLRESGQLEADAHSIMILNKPDKLDPHDRPDILEMYIVKNRFGEEKKIDFHFQEETGTLVEFSKIKSYNNNYDEGKYEAD
jgi:replicative DNA helicase